MSAIKHGHEPCVDDESDCDKEYFSRTYRPLSNLPTPPPSCRDSLSSQSPRSVLEQDELLESALLGPAVHLVNLIPPRASLATPSVPTVHEILMRANLPSETIALAVCILDSLNAKFSHTWRQACPLSPRSAPTQQLHIDGVCPEVIILASLIIAVKFVDDSCCEPTRHYAANWGGGVWACEQINVTERCIMESLGYRILPLWDRGLIGDALADMQRAGRQAAFEQRHHRLGQRRPPPPVMSSGRAVAGFGMQLSPVETRQPGEDVACRSAGGNAAAAAGVLQAAFAGCPAAGFTLDPRQLDKRAGFPPSPSDVCLSVA